jgi:hypothetical protein
MERGPRRCRTSFGAHASVAGATLLTRGARRYRAYFPELTLLAPDGE